MKISLKPGQSKMEMAGILHAINEATGKIISVKGIVPKPTGYTTSKEWKKGEMQVVARFMEINSIVEATGAKKFIERTIYQVIQAGDAMPTAINVSWKVSGKLIEQPIDLNLVTQSDQKRAREVSRILKSL